MATGRATVIDVGQPLADTAAARAWLDRAGEDELAGDLAVLNRALHAYRLAAADPYVQVAGRRQALVARIGFGAGEQVADGLWTAAKMLPPPITRKRRSQALDSQARLAAVLGGRDPALICEDLALRARLDLDQGREREAALQVRIALDAALSELAGDPSAAALADRLAQLRAQRESIALITARAAGGALSAEQRETVRFTLERIEAALRARRATAQR